MPDVAGVFTRTDGAFTGATVWTQEKAASQIVTAAHFDTHDQDIATALNNRVFKDGTTTGVVSINLTATVDAATGVITIGGVNFANMVGGAARANAFGGGAGNFALSFTGTTGFGQGALGAITAASLSNSAFGTGALGNVTSGRRNNAFGNTAGLSVTSANNTYLFGQGVDVVSGTVDGQANFGCTIFGTGWISSGSSAGTGKVGINNNAPTYTFDILTGDLGIGTVGKGLRINESTNGKQGTAVLIAGSKVVSNTSVTANSRIQLTSNVDGGTPGWLRVSARSVGTSFTITSSSGTDTSTVAWVIFEPY